MLQEYCHLPCHQRFQIACYTDSGLSSQPVLVESWSVFSPRASIINAYSSGQNLYLDLRPFIGLMVADFPTQTTSPYFDETNMDVRKTAQGQAGALPQVFHLLISEST